MRFGISIPNFRGAANLETFERVARDAEALGFDDVWVGDHVVLPEKTVSRHPSFADLPSEAAESFRRVGIADMDPTEPVFDPFVVLSYVAALTKRVGLAIGTVVVPLRNPVVTAKMLSSLDVVSGGRVIMGVGVGWLKEEYEAVNADWAHRGQVADEYIHVMKALWTTERPEFAGRFYRLPAGICFAPRPLQKPHIPIWVGGNSEAALRRTARLGDGWHGMYLSPEEIQGVRLRLRKLLAEHGRDPNKVVLSLRVRLEVRERADEKNPCIGPPDRIAESVQRYREAGLDHLQVATPPGPTTEVILTHMRRFADEVWPRL